MAAFLAKEFVALKIDAEKGEGPDLAKRYGVTGFPTMLVVDPQGEEVDRVVGFLPPKGLLAELKPLLEGKSFGALKRRVEKNPSDFDGALGLAIKHEQRDAFKEAEDLYRRIIKAGEAPAKLKARAQSRLPLLEYKRSQGKELSALEKYFEANPSSDDLKDHASALFFAYSSRKDFAKMVQAGDYLLAHGQGDDAEFLNNYAWSLASNGEQPKKALELARKAVELSPKQAHIADTLAEAYSRNGMPREAVETQKKAVDLAEKGERDQFEKRLQAFEKALKESDEGKSKKP